MKGGSLTRETSQPLTKPQAPPTAKPHRTATDGGRPYRKVNCPMMTDENTMMAPTERSMPAVRTTRVCAAPTMPTIATCCRISVSAKGEKNLEPRMTPKPITDAISTISGTPAGLECRACWTRSSAVARPVSKAATLVALPASTVS